MPYNLNLIAPSGYSPACKIEQAAKIWKSMSNLIDDLQVGKIKQRINLRFGGNELERQSDLYLDSFSNLHLKENINIAMPIRGGYGLSRIIDKVNWSKIADIINNNNIKVVGHSDFTLFHLAVYKFTKTITYAGPMFTSDFCVDNINELDSFMLDSFNKVLNLEAISYDILPHSLNKDNHSEGILWGGNLTMICTLVGSEYMPDISEGILFIEDINEPPYRIERSLHQLYHSGILQKQSALIFGNFSSYKTTEYDNGYSLQHVVDYWQHKLSPFNVKIFTNLAFGHCKTKATLPIGKICKIINNQLLI